MFVLMQLGKQGGRKVDSTFRKAVVVGIKVYGIHGSILPGCKASRDVCAPFFPYSLSRRDMPFQPMAF